MNLGVKLSALALSLAFCGASVAQNVTDENAKQNTRTVEGELATQCRAVFTVIQYNMRKDNRANPQKNPDDGSKYNDIVSNFAAYATKRLKPEEIKELFSKYTGQLMTLEVYEKRAKDAGDEALLNQVYERKMSDLNGCNRFYFKHVLPDLLPGLVKK